MIWLLACAPSDTERFVAASQTEDLAQAHAACLAIEGAELRGECVALTVGDRGDAEDVALCEAVEGSWRDECVFLLAEHVEGGPEALALCGDAGRYATSCRMHVWAREAPSLDEAGFEALLAGVEDPERAWRLYYRSGLDPDAALDESICPATAHPAACRGGLQEALSRRIHVVSREQPGAFAEACRADDSAGRSQAIGAAAVRYVPSPAMDAVAKRAIAADCGLDRGGIGSEE